MHNNDHETQTAYVDERMTISESIRESYIVWKAFLDSEVRFWLGSSFIHTKEHCERVLLLCMIIADKLCFDDDMKTVLALASCFHDSRRLDDGRDVGHGLRAADYYRSYCEEKNLPCDMRVYTIMAYHDRHDEEGLAALEEYLPAGSSDIILYQVFKDADALDRVRLGPYGLDAEYLRTQPAKEMIGFAKNLLRDGPDIVLGFV